MPLATLRPAWSTKTVEPQRQFGFWREAVCEAFLQLTVETTSRERFRGRIDSVAIGPLMLNRVDAQDQDVRLDRHGLSRSSKNCFYLNFQAGGAGVIRQFGREAHVAAGQWYVLDSTMPFDLTYGDDFVSLNFELDQSLFGGDAEQIRELMGRAFGGSSGFDAYLSDQARIIAQHAAALSLEQRAWLGRSFLDLIVAGLSGEGDGALRGSLWSRRQRIERYISESIENPRLNPSMIAAACNVSLRALHDLFARSDATVMQYVLATRLRLAYARLSDRSLRGRTIGEIATGCGFVDAAHFSRAFKARYGKTPGEVRDGL